MVNYLARLGWSHGDQEVFSRAELVELFDIKDVASSGAVFDVTKLEWLSQHYLKTMDGRRLAELAEPFVRAAGLTPPPDLPRFVGMLDTLRERAKTLVEMVEQGRFYFEAPSAYDAKAAPKLLTAEGARRLGLADRAAGGLAEFTAAAIERVGPRAHRRARAQARRSRAARPSRGDGPHGLAADLRRARPARPRRDAGSPAPGARARGADGVRLLLARHGQSVWNQVRKFQGANDVGLSDLGRAQAEALGRALRAGYRVAAAYVSPMCRALDTAEIALAGTGIPLVPIPELRELSLGEWEGCTVDEVRARDGNPYRAWVRSPLDCPPPGGEPLPDVCGRVLKAIDQIGASHRNGDDVLVVAHGGVISVYLCHLLGVSFNSLWRMRIDNCSLTIARPPRLVSVNDTAHLPQLPTPPGSTSQALEGTRRGHRMRAGRKGSKGPVPSARRRTTRARMEPSRRGAAHACRVVVSTPSAPARIRCPRRDSPGR